VLVGESVRAARKAKSAATSARAIILGVSLLGAAGLIGLGIQLNGTVNDARDDTNAARREVLQLRHQVQDQRRDLRQLRGRVARRP
jgi:hypothetical protein